MADNKTLIIELGLGNVGVATAGKSENELCAIVFSNLDKCYAIGSVDFEKKESDPEIVLRITNIESLEVVERAIAKIKKSFENGYNPEILMKIG